VKTVAEQVREALREAATAGWSHAEREAFHHLADKVSDRAADKLRALLR